METYSSLSLAVNDLIRRGYNLNFNLRPDRLECVENQLSVHPDDFQIDEVHRFEGMTDPGDSNILYAISSEKLQMKGLLVNAYGAYADTFSAEMARKLEIKRTE